MFTRVNHVFNQTVELWLEQKKYSFALSIHQLTKKIILVVFASNHVFFSKKTGVLTEINRQVDQK